MAKQKEERAKFDKATSDWFKKNWSAQTTVMKCDDCGLYYKPSLGHKCKVKGDVTNGGSTRMRSV